MYFVNPIIYEYLSFMYHNLVIFKSSWVLILMFSKFSVFWFVDFPRNFWTKNLVIFGFFCLLYHYITMQFWVTWKGQMNENYEVKLYLITFLCRVILIFTPQIHTPILSPLPHPHPENCIMEIAIPWRNHYLFSSHHWWSNPASFSMISIDV